MAQGSNIQQFLNQLWQTNSASGRYAAILAVSSSSTACSEASFHTGTSSPATAAIRIAFSHGGTRSLSGDQRSLCQAKGHSCHFPVCGFSRAEDVSQTRTQYRHDTCTAPPPQVWGRYKPPPASCPPLAASTRLTGCDLPLPLPELSPSLASVPPVAGGFLHRWLGTKTLMLCSCRHRDPTRSTHVEMALEYWTNTGNTN